MATPTLRDILDVAIEAAFVAGKRTLAYFNTGVTVDRKSDSTPVTIADREAERLIREKIAQYFPTHAIVGEEEGETVGDADYRWIIDPIDGTKAFVAGVPLYGVLIGCEVKGLPSAGVIYLPALDDMVAAADGLGCTWNGRPCRVSSVDRLADALVVTSSIVRCQERSDAFAKLTKVTRQQRTWGDAFGYALVATGRAEIMLDPALSAWDVGPMIPILREAGGQFTDWHGIPTIWNPDGIGTNGVLHSEVLAILQSETRY
ncbi:MAG: inositol monophosphatase family protein [Capsulimonadales bacterium]|nr:inositol monophosphatase family protein [Capsulimonadales bacterium]